jgi:hypothetical protein
MSERNYQPRFVSNLPKHYEDAISSELRAQVDDLAHRMISDYEDRKRQMYDLLKKYPQDEGLQSYWTPERIEEYASGAGDDMAVESLRSKSVYDINLYDLQSAANQDPKQTLLVMAAMGEAIQDRVEGGIFAADALGFKMPYERQEFSIIRKGFIEEWKPCGGIESALVDMLAQTYIAWQYWLKRSFDVATNQDWAEQQIAKTKSYQEHG